MMKSTALLVETDHYPFINFTFFSNRYNFIKRIIISGIEEDLHDVKDNSPCSNLNMIF